MTVLGRYVMRSILLNSLTVLLVLAILMSFFAFVDDLDNIGKGGYGLVESLQHLLMTLPRRIYELMTPAALLGALLGLGAMAASNELVAMRAAGISILRITGYTLSAGLVMLCIGLFLGEWLAPMGEQQAQNLKMAVSNGQSAGQTGRGIWLRDGRQFVHIRRIGQDQQLFDLNVYRFDEQRRMTRASHAETAYNQDGRWWMEGVKQTQLFETHTLIEQYDKLQWDIRLDPELIEVLLIRPDRYSAVGLYRYITYLDANNQDSSRYQLAFWRRFFQPLDLITMLLLAVPFVFGPLRSVGVGQKVVVGALVGVAYIIIGRSLGHIAVVYNFSPMLAALTPAAVFGAAALWWGRKVG